MEDGEKIFECPAKLITYETKDFLSVYALCRLYNRLPIEGGVLDQTMTFMEAASIVEHISQEAMSEQMNRK